MTTRVARRFTSSWSAIRFVSWSANVTANADAGGVDEDVHPSVPLGVGRDRADALVGVAEIGWDRERIELRGGLLERLGAPRDERELVAVRAQRACDGEADSGRPSSDQRRLHARESMARNVNRSLSSKAEGRFTRREADFG